MIVSYGRSSIVRKFQSLSIRFHVWLSHSGENFFRICAAASGYLAEKSRTSSSAVLNRRFGTSGVPSCVPVLRALSPSFLVCSYAARTFHMFPCEMFSRELYLRQV